MYAYKNFKEHFYYFFHEDSENHLFEVAFYVGFVSRRPNWVRNETTLENATESMSNGVWHKANLKEVKEWADFYNDGSLDFSKWNKNACKDSYTVDRVNV